MSDTMRLSDPEYTADAGGIVLFVDDEPNILSTLMRTFVPVPTVKAIVAQSGESAMELLKKFPVDLIVTDHRMPGMTGNTLLATCR
jgi:CheY-like chemotaxis protein